MRTYLYERLLLDRVSGEEEPVAVAGQPADPAQSHALGLLEARDAEGPDGAPGVGGEDVDGAAVGRHVLRPGGGHAHGGEVVEPARNKKM